MKRYYYISLIMGFFGVCAEGGFRDGFLNKCRKDGIHIWNMNCTANGKMYFCVPCKYYNAVLENAMLSGVSVKITGSFGVLPFLKKNRDRAFLFLGIAFTILFVSLMGMRIWSVSVSGNDKVFSSEILSVCEELGLKTGVKKSSIDVEEFQKALLERTGGRLIWASLNIEGMCAEIEVRETKTVEYDVIGKPCNIIADFDGGIKIFRVYSGTPEIKRGDGVHKGDLLISGVIDYETGQTSFTEARGKITAEHTVKINEKIKDKMTVRRYTETKTYYSLSLFGFEINPFAIKKENCEITKEMRSLEINGVILPFYIGKYTASFYEEEALSDEKTLSLVSLCDYLSLVSETFRNSRVVTHTENQKGGYNGSFDVIDYIGEKSVILLENE